MNVGVQNFEKIRESEAFYIDKTDFIRQWWEAKDDTTLITRPRRFGKTLNMSMLECFFLINMKVEAIFLRDFLFGKTKSIEKCREHFR